MYLHIFLYFYCFADAVMTRNNENNSYLSHFNTLLVGTGNRCESIILWFWLPSGVIPI